MPDGAGNQYLTFRVGPEEYGIDILGVQEIKELSAITPIPNAPAYLRGVTNLRGTIIPVIDVRERFGLAAADASPVSVIVVVRVGARVTGLIVDGVSDVIAVAVSAIQSPPDLGTRADAAYVDGLLQVEDRLVVLLDVQTLIGPEPAAAAART